MDSRKIPYKPIFIQVAEQLENAILIQVFPEETKITSIKEIAAERKISPATVRKGMEVLAAEGVIYQKRGLGMYVKKGAVNQIRVKRQEKFFGQYVAALATEARRLGIEKKEILQRIERSYRDEPCSGLRKGALLSGYIFSAETKLPKLP